MEKKEERTGNGPGLQGQFGPHLWCLIWIRRMQAQDPLVGSPILWWGRLSEVQPRSKKPSRSPLFPKKPWVLLLHSKPVPVSYESQPTLSGCQATAEIPVWLSRKAMPGDQAWVIRTGLGWPH